VPSLRVAFSVWQGHSPKAALGKVRVGTALDNFVAFTDVAVPCHSLCSNWVTAQLNLFSLRCQLLNKPGVTTWGLNNLRGLLLA